MRKMSNYVLYDCVSCINIPFNDIEAVKQTKAYAQLCNVAEKLPYETTLVMDVITASYRKRKRLYGLISDCSNGRGVIVIRRLGALGLTNDEVIENYKLIYKAKVGLVFVDMKSENIISKYSTTDLSYCKISISEDEFDILCEDLKNEEIKSNKGKVSTATEYKDEDFEKVYWAYENYFIPIEVAVSNNYFYMSKRKFYNLCEEYEQSERYGEKIEEQEKLFCISEKAKRVGKVPIWFDTLEKMVGYAPSSEKLALSCKELGVPIMHPINFCRMRLKRDTANSRAMRLKMTKTYRQDLSEIFFVPKNEKRY